MKIVLCVTGGIAAYKAASVASALVNRGDEVQVIMTKHACEFITPLTFQTLTKRKVITDMFDEQDASFVGHIHYGQDWDMVVVAPATANCLAKSANGIADDMVTSTIIAASKPVLFIPAMNNVMWENRITQDNVRKLREYGKAVLHPDEGNLACGTTGYGKFPSTKKVIWAIDKIACGMFGDLLTKDVDI